MNWTGFVIVLIFIFCAAMAAGSILLTGRMIRELPMPFVRSLLYYIIFIFAFGFYGVWGQFIIAAMLGEQLTAEMISSVSEISLLLGLPFLVFAWYMMLRFTAESADKTFSNLGTGLFLAINFGVIITLGIVAGDRSYGDALPAIKIYYVTSVMLFTIVASFILLRRATSPIIRKDRQTIALILLTGNTAQSLVLLLMPDEMWMALLFVFLLFAVTSLIPVYLTYQADISMPGIPEPQPLPKGIEDFFRKYDISPREADIIREICNGLSNQEIADKLFISLQTVKDHTSRIYSKTNVRNRMQLMTLVQSLN